jgi:5,5'-dehydrodivanillate O-demethylase oxygenase subunit
MLTAEQNERLTRVGANTPCGGLMRRYWHPIAASSQIANPGTRPVRILGENLVLYRDLSGKLGLIEPHCAHRRASMIYGLPTECGLRCAYHGWVYDQAGQCIEQPFEELAKPGNRYKDEIKIKAYPVEELGGLIFTYLGSEPCPLLPRWEALVVDNVYREIGFAVIDCNWLQTIENAGDYSHAVSTHFQLSNYALQRMGRPDLKRHSKSSGAAGYYLRDKLHEGPYGIGAVLFPYIDAQADMTYQFRVPMDDTHTLHIWYMAFSQEAQAELGVTMPVQKDVRDIPSFDVPVPKLVNGTEPDWALLDANCGQDMVMWYTQGPIVDRTLEKLGLGDRQIVMYRRLLDEQISLVEQGKEPINTFRDPAQNQCLVPTHAVPMPPKLTPDGRPDRTNAARKYSPIYTKATSEKLSPKALLDPAH